MRLSFDGQLEPSQRFGVYDPSAYANYPGQLHPGTDWPLAAGTRLVAGMAGTIAAVYRRDSYVGRGYEVVIEAGNKQRKTCHMNRIDVTVGQIVKEGDPIGLSGNTGYVLPNPTAAQPNAGAHLHDELLIDGKYVDIEKHLTKEEGTVRSLSREEIIWHYMTIFGVHPTEQEIANYQNKAYDFVTEDMKSYAVNRGLHFHRYRETVQAELAQAKALAVQLATRPTQANLDVLAKQIEVCQAAGQEAMKERDELAAEKAASEKTGNLFVVWIGNLINKLR